jgi:hypothetical protein
MRVVWAALLKHYELKWAVLRPNLPKDVEIIHFMWFEHTDATCSWVGYYSSSKLRC